MSGLYWLKVTACRGEFNPSEGSPWKGLAKEGAGEGRGQGVGPPGGQQLFLNVALLREAGHLRPHN